jgi:pyrroloquinoline-quinone synthase
MTQWQSPEFELVPMNAEIGSYQADTGDDPRNRPRSAFLKRLRDEASSRYHDQHPFHHRMHQGLCTPVELRSWALNRYYYQTRIPIKDALILAKSEDSAFRRLWLERIRDQDGDAEGEGGLAQWRRLAEALGVTRAELDSHCSVLPGVRFACDGYVALVEKASLVEAVAASLTEMLAPSLMQERLAAFERHYPWVAAEALAYFRGRISRAREDGERALAFVLERARTPELETACMAALVQKTRVLWHLLDCVEADSAARRGNA